MQVATEHAEAVGKSAGVGMEEGLLLDGVALHASHIAPRHIKRAALVETHLAYAGLAFRDGATVSACVAANAVAIEFLVELSLANILVQQIAQGGQAEPLGPILNLQERQLLRGRRHVVIGGMLL